MPKQLDLQRRQDLHFAIRRESRQLVLRTVRTAVLDNAEINEPAYSFVNQCLNRQYDPSCLESAVAELYSLSGYELSRPLIAIRRAVSSDIQVLKKAGIQRQVVGRLLTILKDQLSSQSRFQTLWILTNLSCENILNEQFVIQGQLVRSLVGLVGDGCRLVSEQASWCLGNVASDSQLLYCLAVDYGVFDKLVQLANNWSHSAHWSYIWNLCKIGRLVQLQSSQLKLLVPVLLQYILSKNQQSLEDCLQTLASIARNSTPSDTWLEPLQTELFQQLLAQLLTKGYSYDLYIVRILGKISSLAGDKMLVPFSALAPLLLSTSKSTRVQTCWLLSNKVASSSQSARQFFQCSERKRLLFNVLSGTDQQTKRQAFYILRNALVKCSEQSLRFVGQFNVLQLLSRELAVEGQPQYQLLLLTIIVLLVEGDSRHLGRFRELGGIFRAEDLALHGDQRVGRAADYILQLNNRQ